MKYAIAISNKLMQRYMPIPRTSCSTYFFCGYPCSFYDNDTPTQVLGFWGDGFWNLLEFSMQMVLIVVTGHVMASSPFFRNY